MTVFTTTNTHALTQVWLRTTDRKAPLRAVWVLVPITDTGATTSSEGGVPACA